MMWRTMKIKEKVEICISLRIILHIVRKPNSIIVWLFVQNMSNFLTSLPPHWLSSNRRSIFVTVSGYRQIFFVGGTPQNSMTSTKQYVLGIVALVSFSFRASSHYPGWPGWPSYRDQFRLGFIWEISARFPRWEKAKDPGDEFWREIWETKQKYTKKL